MDSLHYTDGWNLAQALRHNPSRAGARRCRSYIRIVRVSLPHHIIEFMAGWRAGIAANKAGIPGPRLVSDVHPSYGIR